MAAVVSPPIEVQQPAPVKSDTQSALWSSFLPDSLSYIVRHKVLGFALARGVSVESRLETDGLATWLLSWSALKLAPVQNKQPWEFSFGVSPYFNTYQLNQTYVFRLQGNDGKVFRSRYEIGQFQAYALAKAAGTWRLPGGALNSACWQGRVSFGGKTAWACSDESCSSPGGRRSRTSRSCPGTLFFEGASRFLAFQGARP